MTFTTCSFQPTHPGWPYASSHHLGVLQLRNLKSPNLLSENNLQTFPLAYSCFFFVLFFFLPSGSWPSLISATLSALPALPFTFHADMLGIPTPPPSPQSNVLSWLDDFAHAVIQLLNGYLLNYLCVSCWPLCLERQPLLPPDDSSSL